MLGPTGEAGVGGIAEAGVSSHPVDIAGGLLAGAAAPHESQPLMILPDDCACDEYALVWWKKEEMLSSEVKLVV
jgi:hypothetical protein